MYLLDTMVVSELSRLQPDARVIAWLSALDPEARFISVISIGELDSGAARLETGKRRVHLQRWIKEKIVADFDGATLPVSLEIARAWGVLDADAIKAGRPLQVADGLIAATALVHGLTLATRNAKDLSGRGVKVFDPWRE